MTRIGFKPFHFSVDCYFSASVSTPLPDQHATVNYVTDCSAGVRLIFVVAGARNNSCSVLSDTAIVGGPFDVACGCCGH